MSFSSRQGPWLPVPAMRNSSESVTAQLSARLRPTGELGGCGRAGLQWGSWGGGGSKADAPLQDPSTPAGQALGQSPVLSCPHRESRGAEAIIAKSLGHASPQPQLFPPPLPKSSPTPTCPCLEQRQQLLGKEEVTSLQHQMACDGNPDPRPLPWQRQPLGFALG